MKSAYRVLRHAQVNADGGTTSADATRLPSLAVWRRATSTAPSTGASQSGTHLLQRRRTLERTTWSWRDRRPMNLTARVHPSCCFIEATGAPCMRKSKASLTRFTDPSAVGPIAQWVGTDQSRPAHQADEGICLPRAAVGVRWRSERCLNA